MMRTSGAEVPMHPDMEHEMRVKSERVSGETNVLDASLDYRKKKVPGLVFKRFANDPHLSPAEQDRILADTLMQWSRIREAKKDLIKERKEGFNIPATVRGICTLDGGVGFLITDLSAGGRNDVFDVKLAPDSAKKISPKDWQQIKAAVINDIDIAIERDIKIIGGNRGLDAWLVVKNKKTKQIRVFLSDISKFTSTILDPFLIEGNERNDSTFLKNKALTSLESVEKPLIEEWNELSWWKLPWLRHSE